MTGSLGMMRAESEAEGNELLAGLGAGEIHIWYASWRYLEDPETRARCERLLDSTEREHLREYLSREAMLEYLAARVLVRITLSRYRSVAPESWSFTRSENGKPTAFAPDGAIGIPFNVSHSDGLVGCCVGWNRRVGLDLESVHRNIPFDDLARDHLSGTEQADLRYRHDALDRKRRFLRYWTLKEAYAKATGTGIAQDSLQDLSFRIDGEEPGETIRDSPGWRFALLSPTPHHVGAVAVEWIDRPGDEARLKIVERSVMVTGAPEPS